MLGLGSPISRPMIPITTKRTDHADRRVANARHPFDAADTADAAVLQLRLGSSNSTTNSMIVGNASGAWAQR